MLIPLTSTFKMVKIAEILLWRIPWTEEPGRLLFMGCKSWTRCSAILISYRYLTTIKSIYIAFELASARIQTVMWTLALNEPQAADSTSNLRHLMLTPPRWNLTFDSWPLIWTLTWKLEQNLRLRLKSDANPHQEVKPWNWAGDFDLQIPGLWFAPWSQTVHVDLNLSPDANGSWIWIFEFSSVQFSCSLVSNSATPRTAACQASLSITNSRSLLKLTFIELAMPSNHLILCRPLLLPTSIFPSIRVFSNESVLHIRWPKYWSFSFSISPSNEHSGLISFTIDCFDLAIQGTLKSLLQHPMN